jgi:predicted alpha/beta-hydrolase family hydrolase
MGRAPPDHKPMSQAQWQIDGPPDAGRTLVLAHGAGQDMRSAFLDAIASGLGARGLRVVRFRFPYMAQMAAGASRRPPDREPVLLAAWHRVIDELLAEGTDPARLLIGGKSLGGRIASRIAEPDRVAGLVCLGYPFHPPGRPERPRIEHLRDLSVPTLICQGKRDPFGTPDEVAGYALSRMIQIIWIEDGEHSFRPAKASGRTWEANLQAAVASVAAFASVLSRGAP